MIKYNFFYCNKSFYIHVQSKQILRSTSQLTQCSNNFIKLLGVPRDPMVLWRLTKLFAFPADQVSNTKKQLGEFSIYWSSKSITPSVQRRTENFKHAVLEKKEMQCRKKVYTDSTLAKFGPPGFKFQRWEKISWFLYENSLSRFIIPNNTLMKRYSR